MLQCLQTAASRASSSVPDAATAVVVLGSRRSYRCWMKLSPTRRITATRIKFRLDREVVSQVRWNPTQPTLNSDAINSRVVRNDRDSLISSTAFL